ncbi:LysR substrate-binding domain-containing protein [Paraburkholderia sp. IMGN_8]|uniref:LysR substrate-binding domain-containing protein n=1 Tax=Paraburkholderia sp. IMGN_8 TaxID=3136564 RepID=UPI0031013DBA
MLMHPEVDVRLDLDDRYVDIGARGYDLAIRICRLEDSSLKARRIAVSRRGIYGSEAYLKREGLPRTLDDLATPALRMPMRHLDTSGNSSTHAAMRSAL